MAPTNAVKKSESPPPARPGTSSQDRRPCFLCQVPCAQRCPNCNLVDYCCKEHLRLHQHPEDDSVCLPYEVAHRAGVGRILRATRPVRPMELVLVDRGVVVGPNYTSPPVCLECLKPAPKSVPCSGCRFPMCSIQCCGLRKYHSRAECEILSVADSLPDPLGFRGPSEETAAYSLITPLRMLLLEECGGDSWMRTSQLMDHEPERRANGPEWDWYQRHVVDFLRGPLGQAERWSGERIHRAVGMLNVNSVALQFGRRFGGANNEPVEHPPLGKGLYPIFAIMSHQCVCNARYTINPSNLDMHVRARRRIAAGEEITVQYLSALHGNLKRRKKIREEWYFDCCCHRCSDPTECGSNISAVKCFGCLEGDLLPKAAFSSQWKCNRCTFETESESIESLVDAIEENLEDIGRRGEFAKYEDFIDKYSGSILHQNHFLIMTATRNLIQYLTYGASNSETTVPELLRKKYDLCRHFSLVLGKVDPGFSEIRNFVQKELNFCRLLLCQHDLQTGKISREEYLSTARQCLSALDDVERNKKLIQFK